MFPTHTRVPRASMTPTAQSSAGSAAGRESASASVPAADFLPIHVRGDGDCLFRAVYLGLTHAQRPDSETSPDELTEMRQRVTQYMDSHWAALQNNACFLGENTSPQGLRSLVAAERQWDSDNGDLVPLFLAHTLGRDVKIFRHEQHNPHRYRLIQNCPGNNPTLPGGSGSSDAAPICLLYIGLNHYSYLQLTQTSGSPAAGPRPSKKPRLGVKAPVRVKSELGVSGKQRGKIQPPLVPFTVAIQSGLACLSQRFHISPNMALDRASSTEHSTVMPMTWVSDADIATMSQRPIIQHPEDPNQAHPSLQQPVQANMKSRLNEILKRSPKLQAAHVSIDLLKQVRAQLNDLLKSPEKRQAHEASHFALAKIDKSNLPEAISSGHPTLGMRGVLAQQKLPAGTPLQYSGQYLDKKQWQAGVNELSQLLQSQSGFAIEAAQTEAERAMAAYTWEGATYRSKKYDISAFGAGNVAAMINHDADNANMGAAYFSTQDKGGKPAAKVMVYFALREIAAGEQLLVNYGDHYSFDPAAEGEARVPSAGPGHISGRLAEWVKIEPALATQIATGWAATAPSVERWPQDLDVASLSSATSSDNNGDDGVAINSMASGSVADLSINLLPEEWREPPIGYENKNAAEQLLLRCEYREKIRQCYDDKKPAGTVLPDPLADDAFPQWCQVPYSIGIKSLDRLLQTPADFHRLTDDQKKVRKYKGRKHIDSYNLEQKRQGKKTLDYPKWMQRSYRAFRDMSRQEFIDTLKEPPMGYEQFDDQKKIKKNSNVREKINKYNEHHSHQEPVPIPAWCRKVFLGKATPLFDDKTAQQCPEEFRNPPDNYGGLKYRQVAKLRFNMRKKIDQLSEKQIEQGLKPYRYAEWFKPKITKGANTIESRMQPPSGYSAMSDRQKIREKEFAKYFFKRLNKKLKSEGRPEIECPDWCKSKREAVNLKPLHALLEQPDGYASMTEEDRRYIRAGRRAAIDFRNRQREQDNQSPIDYADWMQEQ